MQEIDSTNRLSWSREPRDPDGIALAVLLTLFAHLALFWVTPERFVLPGPEEARAQPVWIVFAEPEEEPDPVMEEERRFVMAPADVPEERPEPTPNFSDRFQVAAQPEEAPPSETNDPMVEGDEPDSNRIVQGNPFEDPSLQPPSAAAEAGQSPQQQLEAAPAVASQQPPAQQLPSWQRELDEGPEVVEQPDVSDVPTQETIPDAATVAEVTSDMDGSGDATVTLPPQVSSEQGLQPRPRMRVQRDTSFGPIRDSTRGAIRVGNLAFDAEHSEFGEYWRRVAEVIEARWRSILFSTRAVAYSGNRVTVEFFITREGNVEDVRILGSDANRLAETISIDAITSEAPFFRWSPEMILSMGERTSARITFIY
ncbi:MAG: hypothetical protein LR015_09440 [Verrucomicrobia bacterium]|nr:hypothetical protein [Verrucomicrobiota bacterium]